MDWLGDSLAVAGLFVLRLGVPLAITLAVAYGLRRLDAQWEADAQHQTRSPRETMAADCVYAGRGDTPCWVARRQAEGQLSPECYGCARFALRQVA
jgi:hypothetical protein